MEAKTNIRRMMAGNCIVVPDYQRAYSWEVNERGAQVRVFLEDLIDYIHSGSNTPYYFGHFLFERRSDSEYAVIDGQQRITTISIFACAAFFVLRNNRELTIEEQECYEDIVKRNRTYRFITVRYDNILFRNYVVDMSRRDLSGTKTTSGQRIVNAFDYLRNELEKMPTKEVERLLNAVVTASCTTYIVETEAEAIQMFFFQNNRGKPLCILEKLKNRLLFLTAKLSCQLEDKILLSEYINEAWRKVYDYLGKNPDGMLDEDDFLSAHLTLIRKPKETSFSIQAAEEKVFQMFCNRTHDYTLDYGAEDSAGREPIVDYKKIENYVLDIAEFVPYWYEVYNSLDERIRKIRILNDSKEMRILLATLLMLKNDSIELADKTIDLLLKIAFRNSLPSMNVVDERTYTQRARELHNKELNLNELNDKLEGFINTDCNVEGVITSD